MKTILEILNRVAATSSKKEKEAILKKELPENKLLQKVAKYALDQGKSYNMTALNLEIINPAGKDLIDNIFVMLDYLARKKGASNGDIAALSCMCISPACQDIVTRIITRDLDIGAGANTFNKAMPGLIHTIPYNRYASFAKLNPEKVDGEYLIVQLKNDGMFAYMRDPGIAGGKIFCTRQGHTFDLRGHLEEDFHFARKLQEGLGKRIILEGELLVLNEKGTGYLPRKTGNGFINELIQGGDSAIGSRIRYVTWGYVTADEFAARQSTEAYADVWNRLKGAHVLHAPENCRILLTESQSVANYAGAMDYYREQRSKGHEGAMLKVANKLMWKHNSSGNLDGFKLKAEAEAEFEIVDAYYGDPKGKWAGLLGGLIVKTSCGKLFTRIGGGFTDAERKLGVPWWQGKRGKIITGKFTDITIDKTDRSTYCLDHSRMPHLGGAMVETRFSEKEEADTLEYCFAQLKVA